jgi:hypothetical protein
MDKQTALYIVGIIGGFISVGLTINAYFIRSLLESLNQVKIQTAVLIEKTDSKERRLRIVEDKQDDLEHKYHEVLGMINKH